MDHLCYFCPVLLCFHARLFIDALWSPAGKGLTSWLSFVMSYCEVVTFPFVSCDQVWCLIVSNSGLCLFSYFLLSKLFMTFKLLGQYYSCYMRSIHFATDALQAQMGSSYTYRDIVKNSNEYLFIFGRFVHAFSVF